MSVLKSEISLVDKMSGPLEGVINALNSVMVGLEQVGDASSIEGLDFTEARRSIDLANAELREMQTLIEKNNGAQQRFNKTAKDSSGAFDGALGGLKRMAAAYISLQGASRVVGLSDSLTQATARLNLMNDGLQSTDELLQQAYDSAMRSRAGYLQTADIVSKLGLRAKDAFGNNTETIAFAENLNKMFVIAGASQQETASATLQLTQALGSGVLRGEELRAVFEAAPNVIQQVADYMGVPIGQIRKLAEEGKITADIVKGAILGATEEINEQFESMPLTWSQVWTMGMNKVILASEPLLDLISMLAQNWETLEPIILSVAGALAVYASGMAFAALQTWIADGAAKAFFATLIANPFTWIALGAGVLVYQLYKLTQAMGGVQIVCLTTKQHVVYAWQKVQHHFAQGIAVIISQVNWLQYYWYAGMVKIQNHTGNMKANAIMILQSMINGAIDTINDFISTLNQLPGVEIGLIEHVTFGTTAVLENEARTQARNKALENLKGDINDKISGRKAALDAHSKLIEEEFKSRQMEIDAMRIQNSLTGYHEPSGGGSDSGIPMLEQIAGNTGAMKDALEVSTEHLKYVRELAEQGTINRFVLAELKVEQNNNISAEEGNIYGLSDRLKDELLELMEVTARGV